jgi:predicted extracellular nuclease
MRRYAVLFLVLGLWLAGCAELARPPADEATIALAEVSGACAGAFTPIYDIQGSGPTTPLAGQVVTTQGVVIGDYEGPAPALRGFYLQDPVGDDDPETSDGIFVFNGSANSVSLGDVVRVTGRAGEFQGQTQISAVSEIVACGTGTVEPTPIMLPVTSLSDFERYEGMLVTFPQELVISEYFNFDRFGEIVLALPPAGLDRPFQPTSYEAPGPAAAAVAVANALARITLDDARTNQNPTPAIHPNGELFTLDNRFRGGDLVTGAVGILDYRFNLYRLQPVGPVPYAAANPRTPTPDDVGGDVQVAAFNVLNYFSTLDTGAPICGPLGNQGCRGADNAEEFDRQRSKIIAALAIIDADVVGLIEIENGGDALADLVSGLNAMVGAGTYAGIDTGPIGPDAIRVALIYQPAGVTPIGDYAVLDTPDFLDPLGSGGAQNRPALAQTFASTTDGGALTVVVNHLKSKGSPCAGDSDPDQGNCNVTRTLAAERLLEWIATDPTGAQDPDYLFIGDFNAYDEEDPIATLAAGGLTDLLEAYQGEFVYTYLFGAQFGHLDYALSTPTLTTQVTGATAWAINADEPDILDYDTSFKEPAEAALFAPDPYRSSDHDPVIVGLDLNAPPVCSGASASVTSLWPANHRLVAASVLGVTDPEGDPLQIIIDAIYQDEPVNADDDGNTMPDAVIGSGNAFEVRAERSGEGDGRVYHVMFTALDATGSCSGEVLIGVPLNQRRNGVAIDGGPLYDSTVP